MTLADPLSDVWHEWEKLVPFDYQEAELDHCSFSVEAEVRDWIGTLSDTERTITQGGNMVLKGPVGAGKTHTAFAALAELRFIGHPHPHRFHRIPPNWRSDKTDDIYPTTIHYWTVDQLIRDCRKNEDSVFQILNTRSVIFLDDIGATRQTDYVLDQIYGVLDFCRARRKPVITTTNLELPELEKYIGPAGYSRLVHGAAVVAVEEENRRA